MPVKVDKNKEKIDETLFSGEAVSEAVFEAFDKSNKEVVGQLCLDARLKKGLTQEQASKILKVKVSIIKDFEDGNEFDLPGLAYKIGFVRSYAFLLGMDSDTLVEDFKESLQLNTYKEDYKFLTPNTEATKLLPMGAILSLFICMIIYTGWYYTDSNNITNQVSNEILDNNKTTFSAKNDYIIIEESLDSYKSISSDNKKNNNKVEKIIFNDEIEVQDKKIENDEKKNLASEKIIKPVEIETNEMSAKANERDPDRELVLKAIGNSWVEIEDLNGNILMTRLMRPGETYIVPNTKGLIFNTGNAGALSLSKGDILLPSLGDFGEVIKARPLTIKAFTN
jgi:cytoskeleton protein RodZ